MRIIIALHLMLTTTVLWGAESKFVGSKDIAKVFVHYDKNNPGPAWVTEKVPSIKHDITRHPDITGWEALFTDDLSNASFPIGIWTVTNGVITASKDKPLWTVKEYNNFVLDLEFKTGENANSGVIVYCSDQKRWVPNSVEIQIQDDYGSKWDGAQDNFRCGGIFGHLSPKNYDRTSLVVKKPGEWNRYTITCMGSKIDVVLNGIHTASLDMKQFTSSKKNPDGSPVPNWLSKPLASLVTKGKIGFQGKHGGAPIWFRNIKIKKLPLRIVTRMRE